MAGDKDTSPPPPPGRARATLAQIRQMYSSSPLIIQGPTIIRNGMKGPETWRHISGNGADAVYELQGHP